MPNWKILTLRKPNGPKPTINLSLIFRNLQNTEISELGHYAEMIFQNLPKTKISHPNTIDDVSTSKMTISKSKHQKIFIKSSLCDKNLDSNYWLRKPHLN